MSELVRFEEPRAPADIRIANVYPAELKHCNPEGDARGT